MELQKPDKANSLRRMKELAREYGIVPWIFDTRKTLRRRAWCHLFPKEFGTTEGIRDRILALCPGVRFVSIERTAPGMLSIRLKHHWLGVFWRRSNLRKIDAALPDIRPVGAHFTVK
jgi:hypothetical protein